ncbi:hypothetical protein K456DRAFT_1038570 [Colletotrichum gloeosporioides 23]|nr:hypothetical protein K456DRAFT_1038570 [Colletotrichum gloeosporioides 23]
MRRRLPSRPCLTPVVSFRLATLRNVFLAPPSFSSSSFISLASCFRQTHLRICAADCRRATLTNPSHLIPSPGLNWTNPATALATIDHSPSDFPGSKGPVEARPSFQRSRPREGPVELVVSWTTPPTTVTATSTSILSVLTATERDSNDNIRHATPGPALANNRVSCICTSRYPAFFSLLSQPHLPVRAVPSRFYAIRDIPPSHPSSIETFLCCYHRKPVAGYTIHRCPTLTPTADPTS